MSMSQGQGGYAPQPTYPGYGQPQQGYPPAQAPAYQQPYQQQQQYPSYQQPQPAAPAVPKKPLNLLKIWAIVALAGLAIAGVGYTIVGFGNYEANSCLQSLQNHLGCTAQSYNNALNMSSIGAVMSGVGVLIGGVGIGLYFLALPGRLQPL